MMSFNRVAPSAQKVLVKGFINSLQSGQQKVVVVANIVGCNRFSDSAKSWKITKGMTCIEGFQGEIRDLSVTEARHVLNQASQYQKEGPSLQGTQDETCFAKPRTGCNDAGVHTSVLDGLGSHVSLYGCMQSSVPCPQQSSGVSSGYGSYLNMPGGGGKLLDKYLAGGNNSYHPSRQLSTSARRLGSQQGAQKGSFDESVLLTDPTPQGVQGDNCVDFKLWMENCQRYNLPNCDEQMEALKSGRKTLAQVFLEQQDIIRLVAESYKEKQIQSKLSESSEQSDNGSQEYFHYNFAFDNDSPCPQGLQGQDCATFKAWAQNCHHFGFNECDEQLLHIQEGRKSLQDVFEEQTEIIKKIVADYQQKRTYSTSSQSQVDKINDSIKNNPHTIPPSNSSNNLTARQKLQRAVKEYGTTVIVFHIGISLLSLGGFYVLVSR